VDIGDAAWQLDQVTHDTPVAFDCIVLDELNRAHAHATTARTAVDAAVTILWGGARAGCAGAVRQIGLTGNRLVTARIFTERSPALRRFRASACRERQRLRPIGRDQRPSGRSSVFRACAAD